MNEKQVTGTNKRLLAMGDKMKQTTEQQFRLTDWMQLPNFNKESKRGPGNFGRLLPQFQRPPAEGQIPKKKGVAKSGPAEEEQPEASSSSAAAQVPSQPAGDVHQEASSSSPEVKMPPQAPAEGMSESEVVSHEQSEKQKNDEEASAAPNNKRPREEGKTEPKRQPKRARRTKSKEGSPSKKKKSKQKD
jgi:hypothetical protein